MDITLDKKGTTEASIKISLKEEDYQPQIEEKVKQYRKQVNLKGFRPGKVPAGLIKKMYGKAIKIEEINELLAAKLPQYIRDNDLKIVGEPLPDREAVESIDWDHQSDFEFSYDVGYINDFSYDLSEDVKITKYVIPVTEEKIDETIENLRKRFGETEKVEGPSEKDDELYGLLSAVDDPSSANDDSTTAQDPSEASEALNNEAAGKELTHEELIAQNMEAMDKEVANLEEKLEQMQARISQQEEEVEKHISNVEKAEENDEPPTEASQQVSEDIDQLRQEAERLQDEISSLKASNDQEIEDSLDLITLGTLSDEQAAPFLGVKADDEVYFDIRETFPKDETVAYMLNISAEEAAKIAGEYRYKVKRIIRPIPAELNQELYDSVFGPDQAEDEASFREKVREAIQDNYQHESEGLLTRDIRNHFVEHTDIDIPREFLRRWILTTNDSITEEQLNEEFDDYIKEMKWSLLSNKIAEDKDIQVEQEEIKQKAREAVFAQFGMMNNDMMNDARFDPIVDNYLQAENGNNYMRMFNQARADKVMDEIMKAITIEEKEVTTEEFNRQFENE